jgi:outer membrane protein assembly factor BamD (BamD/ComL family)
MRGLRLAAVTRAALVAGWVLAAAAALAAERATPLEEARKLAASEQKSERVRALRLLKALARPGATRGDEATLRYAELCLRFHAEGEKRALEEAKKAFADLQKSAGSRWGLRGKIGLWRVAAAEGKRAEAVKSLDRFLGRQTRCERAVEAAYYLGCIYAGRGKDLGELRKAERALSYAGKLHRSVSKYTPPVVESRTIAAKLAWVKRRIGEFRAGELKVLFDRAEKLRKAKKHDAAIKIYRQIRKGFPGHDLTELSGLRIAQCHFAKKDLRKAVDEARQFVASDPLGAYRGHAHLLIGDIHLEHLFDVRGSEPEFRCVLDPGKRPKWVTPRRQRLIAYRKLDPEKTPPAKEAHKSWKAVLHGAHERVGILEYIRRNFQTAATHFATSARLKPVKGLEREPGVGMAEVAELCRKRKMPLDEALLGQGDDRSRLVLFLASVYIKGWKDDRAYGLFTRVYRNEFKKATPDQRAYARARMGARHLYKGETAKAVAIYKEIETKFAGSRYAADALLQHASALSREGKLRKALPYIDACYTRYRGTKWADWALYQRAFIAYRHEPAPRALKYYRRAISSYPRSDYADSAKVMIKKLEKKIREGKTAPDGFPLDKKEAQR